jgi:hypothetical protein
VLRDGAVASDEAAAGRSGTGREEVHP